MSRKLFYVSVSSLVLAVTISGYLLDSTLFGAEDSVQTARLTAYIAPAPDAASKAKAAALARFPGGTADRVVQLANGSYVVHLTGTAGPHRVFISKTFQVTGAT